MRATEAPPKDQVRALSIMAKQYKAAAKEFADMARQAAALSKKRAWSDSDFDDADLLTDDSANAINGVVRDNFN